MDVKRIWDHILALTFAEEQYIFTVISSYAPHVGENIFIEGYPKKYGHKKKKNAYFLCVSKA